MSCSSSGAGSFVWQGWSVGPAINSKLPSAKLRKPNRSNHYWRDRDDVSLRRLHRDLGNPRNLSGDSGAEVFEDSPRDGESEKVSSQHSALSIQPKKESTSPQITAHRPSRIHEPES